MSARARKWKMWAGYIDDHIDLDYFEGTRIVYGAIYPFRWAARKSYQDVRPVEVREIRGKKRRK